VKHFLEQCLASVEKALLSVGNDGEVIVLDNCSSDNSVAYLQAKFPTVQFVVNEQNLGFAKACNKGYGLSTGRYVLFLNPDTIVPEDCFQKCIALLASRTDAGALGIRMLDGKGRFLKESKRAFPSPLTALYKLVGLARLFPHSKTFARYHLGYLSEQDNHEVDVLAGAFMMIKRNVLEQIGRFDEIFFMYGEDIDMSFRIQRAGYENIYFAGSTIIHFKGESTRRGSLNYVRMFYAAMSIFVRKHYGKNRAGVFNFFIHLAIWARAVLSALGKFVKRIGLPVIDAGFILLAFWIAKFGWSTYVRTDVNYEQRLLWTAFPLFTLFFLLVAYYAGMYDRWYKRSRLAKSMLVAALFLLAGYSLLPETYRFSRAIILFGAILAFFFISMLRRILLGLEVLQRTKTSEDHPRTLIAGTQEEYAAVMTLLKEAGFQERVIGRIGVMDNDTEAVGYYKEIPAIAKHLLFNEVIFCEGTLSFKEIIETIQQLPSRLTVKFHAGKSGSIVGSDSKYEVGEALSKENGYHLADPYNRRLKRLVDVGVSVFALVTFPVHLVLVKKPLRFFGHCLLVLFYQKTWVGYCTKELHLPRLRPCVVACNGIPASAEQTMPYESLLMADQWYARDYEPAQDVKLLLRVYRQLGA
jgi:GT2 family glycosyltransferase